MAVLITQHRCCTRERPRSNAHAGAAVTAAGWGTCLGLTLGLLALLLGLCLRQLLFSLPLLFLTLKNMAKGTGNQGQNDQLFRRAPRYEEGRQDIACPVLEPCG